MKIAAFRADSDLVGRRIRIAWVFVLEGADTLASIPAVTLRRKTRDFEYPTAGAADAFLVYSSAAFPPAGSEVTEPFAWERRDGGLKVQTTVDSARAAISGQLVETLRITASTSFNSDGTPARRRIEVLDINGGAGLQPGTTYYYQIFSSLLAAVTDPSPYRSTATATESYRLGRRLYEMLPAINRRHDVVTYPVADDAAAIPEAATQAGQLRRFVDLFGVALDSLRSGAEGLKNLHDTEQVDYRRLPLLARWIGWDLSFSAGIPLQRHEIRYAPALYRITGTIPGCMIWVKRLTGWDSQIKEFYRNVFFTNNTGDPEVPGDQGSRTVDTSNAALLANMGKFADTASYTYDTGTADSDWYAYNVVGIFIAPPDSDTVAAISRKRGKLVNNLALFLPVNIRGVVILQLPATADSRTDAMDLLQGTKET